MGKRIASTPRSRVRSSLRKLWLTSRERAAALKREGYCCEECHRKQSKAKGKEIAVEVHHLNGVEWEKMIDYIYRHLLVNPIALGVLCPDCHKKEHEKVIRPWLIVLAFLAAAAVIHYDPHLVRLPMPARYLVLDKGYDEYTMPKRCAVVSVLPRIMGPV